jgi:hypothetical protein
MKDRGNVPKGGKADGVALTATLLMCYFYSLHYAAWFYYPYPYLAPTYSPPHNRSYAMALSLRKTWQPPLPTLDAPSMSLPPVMICSIWQNTARMQYTPSEPLPSHPEFDRITERFDSQMTLLHTSRAITSPKYLRIMIARIR